MRYTFVVFLQQWQVYQILNIFTCTAVFILKKRFWDKCFNPKLKVFWVEDKLLIFTFQTYISYVTSYVKIKQSKSRLIDT